MKRLLAALAAGALLLCTTAASGGSSSSSGSSSRSSSSSSSSSHGGPPSGTTYSKPSTTGAAPKSGTQVSTSQARPPAPQRAPAHAPPTRVLAAAPVNPPRSYTGYTMPNGRPAIVSPITHTYVEVHHYSYNDWGAFGWRPYDHYYGCLYCFSGPYAYAPVPMSDTRTQPTWAYGLEILVMLALFGGLIWFGIWMLRR